MLLQKNVWIPILILLLVVMGVGLFYRQKTADQAPITIIKPVEIEKPKKEVPIGDTSQGGHWHGDEWHAEPHTPPAPVENVPPDTTARTPPDDYHGDPLYWVPGIQYETLSTTHGFLASEPVIPPEKERRMSDVDNLPYREGTRHLTSEQLERLRVEIFAEGFSDLDVAKLLVSGSIVSGYQKYARAYVQRAIDADPNNFEAHLIRADLLPYAEKEAEYRRLLEWKPDSIPVLLSLGLLVSDDQEAIGYLEKSAHLDPTYLNYNAFVKLSERYQRVGDYEKALAALKTLRDRPEGSTDKIERQIEAIEKGEPLILKGGIYR